jgi:hypothetical protein
MSVCVSDDSDNILITIPEETSIVITIAEPSISLQVVPENNINIILENEDAEVCVESVEPVLVTLVNTEIIVQVGCDQSGLTPPPGIADASKWLVIEKTAGENIQALRIVKFLDKDTVVYAHQSLTYADAKGIGMAITAGNTGELVQVLIMGVVEDVFFNFPANTLMFLADNGVITDTVPVSGHSVIVGECPTTDVFTLSIREPIILP